MMSKTIQEVVKQVPGVLWVEVESKSDGEYVDVIASSDATAQWPLKTYEEMIHKVLEKTGANTTFAIRVTKVKPETGLDIVKKELEESEGVLGVHISPIEWTPEKQVKKVRFVISVDETRFESLVFQDKFQRLAVGNGIKVALEVNFVLYRPKQAGIIL